MSNATELHYCDWRIEVYGCAMSELWVTEVTVALISYALLAFSGTFVFGYRYKYMWQGLFVDHGHGIRPLPIDCLLFFWTIGCYFRGLHSLLMLLDVYTHYWQREMMQESGWTILCYGAVCYIVGVIYTIPANYTHGARATIKIESKKSDPQKYSNSWDIYLPTPTQLNWLLAIWCLYPTLTVFPFSILSGVSRDHGDVADANRWTSAQYIAYFIHDTILALSGAYYGINFMLILRSSMKQFNRSTTSFHKTKNGTREALDRLKYTMTYIAVLPLISGPWWGIYGIYHDRIISSINGVNLFLSVMWNITGVQPLIAVVQYVLAKRVYLHYTGQLPSSSNENSSTQSTTSPEVTDYRAAVNRNPTTVVNVNTVVITKADNQSATSRDSMTYVGGSENSENTSEVDYDHKIDMKSFNDDNSHRLDLPAHFQKSNSEGV